MPPCDRRKWQSPQRDMRSKSMPKRRIFITFDHDDTDQVNGFLGLRNILDSFEFFNHKLDRRIKSTDGSYVARNAHTDFAYSLSLSLDFSALACFCIGYVW